MIQERADNSLAAPRARRWEFRWLCGLILSFAYELPIWYATSYDRVNPRLFDVMFFVGVLTVLPNLRRGVRLPPLFRIWAYLVAVFCFCALVWASGILPWKYGQFSLFFAGRYIQGLIAIYIAARIPLDARQKRIIHYMIVAGGVFVALYAIPQYNRIGTIESTEWTISGDKTVTTFGRVVFGPLSRAYFHIAIFSALSFAMALALVPTAKNAWRRWCCLGVALFVAWPALACGSRSGIAGVGIVLLSIVYFRPKLIATLSLVVIAAALFIYLADVDFKSVELDEVSLSFRRLQGYSGDSHNSILNRVIRGYSINQYMWDGLPVPFIGAGFYVAPVNTDAGLVYRVGYGIHNGYMFAFEQGGIMAFLLFLMFLVCAMLSLNRIQKFSSPIDSGFALGALALLIALLAIALGGHVFWLGFNTANLNTYIVLLLVLATRRVSAEPPELAKGVKR